MRHVTSRHVSPEITRLEELSLALVSVRQLLLHGKGPGDARINLHGREERPITASLTRSVV